jgi:LysM repeat protein
MRPSLPQIALFCLLLSAAMILAVGSVQAEKIPAIGPGAPNMEILTSTPGEDGSIVHIVQQDESLASISESYAISMADLRSLNGMGPTSNLIFPGQKLIVRLPQPPTETPTFTPTVPRPTRTPTPVIPTRTPRPTATITPTLLPSPTTNPSIAALNSFWQSNHVYMLYAMIALCACGFIWTLWSGFRKGS